MQIENIPLSNLKYDEFNARTHDEVNLKAIRFSLERYGQVEPLVIQKSTNRVIGGNGRLEAMQSLGWQKADVVIVDLNDVQARDLGLRLNRTAELAEWDMDQLRENIEFLQSADIGIDIEEIGFSDADFLDLNNNDDDDSNNETNQESIKHELIIELKNIDDKQSLFVELRDRGFRVKSK